ncbi:hypothetical protein GLE_3450 [Lysobacter enzymogenes]|uniref:Uncharacterized protein n=1 Tax=Lysobacter enzymogenes TaxID=69 RepID=A0A0S2DJH8_LYSEN|nr:hypothetical protein GLE_3450 [Lysobacter enzymogenes]
MRSPPSRRACAFCDRAAASGKRTSAFAGGSSGPMPFAQVANA